MKKADVQRVSGKPVFWMSRVRASTVRGRQGDPPGALVTFHTLVKIYS